VPSLPPTPVAPWMFTIVWSLIKTALSAHTQTKIHILNSSYHEPLAAYVSPSNLPDDLRPAESRALRPSPVADDEGGGASFAYPGPHPGQHPGQPCGPDSGYLLPVPPMRAAETAAEAAAATEAAVAEGASKSPDSRSRSSFLAFMKRPKPAGECGSVVVAVSDLEMAAPLPGSCRVTIRTLIGDGSLATEDTQVVELPLATKHLLVLSLGPGDMVDNTLRLGFSLDMGTRTLAATLEVLVDGRVPVEGLLCWVSFFDERGRTLANLKAFLSYRPARAKATRLGKMVAPLAAPFSRGRGKHEAVPAIEPKQLSGSRQLLSSDGDGDGAADEGVAVATSSADFSDDEDVSASSEGEGESFGYDGSGFMDADYVKGVFATFFQGVGVSADLQHS